MRLRISNLFQLGAILALCSTLLLAAPAGAQQPSSVNPTASSVKEEQLLDRKSTRLNSSH